MPDETMMGRVAERARQLYSQGKALVAPMTSEQQGLKEKQHQIDEATQTPAETPKMNYTPAPSDYVHPGMKYGDKPGEQRLPSYQEGGDVPEDQTAKLDRGERVLNPEEAAAYRQAEQEVDVAPEQMKYEGQTVDTGGARAIPNPKGIKPMMDTDKPEPNLDYKMNGAQMRTDNAPLGRPVMSEHNTPVPGVAEPAMMQEISTKEPVIEQPKYSGMTDQSGPSGAPAAPAPDTSGYTPQMGKPDAMMGAARQPGALESAMEKQRSPEQEKQAQIAEDLKVVEQDKLAAMQSGDLTKLGMANIHERQLKAALPELPQPTAPSPEENRKNQMTQLRDKMINAPTEMERFQAEKDLARLKQNTPWGSPENHPGVMGKFLHGLSAVAQGVGQGIAPYAVNAVPGSRADIARHEAAGEQGVEQAQKKEQQTAATAVEQAKPELQQEQQRITEEKNKMQHEAQLRQRGYKTDTSGAEVPIPYEELSTHEQGVYDLNQAKGNAQNAIAELKQAQADPNSPQSQLILAKAKAEGEKMDQAGQKLGLDVDKYKAEYLGLSHDNTPLPGAQVTPEGKPIGTKVGAGAKGAQPTANQKMKADLSENVVNNIDNATKLIRENPDLFGKISGRFTSVAQMTGSNDPAIAQLGNLIHMTAMAVNGIHGLRSAQAIEGTERELINRFKNSPEATIAALKETRRSVGDYMKDGGKSMPPDPDLVPKGASAEVLDKNGSVIGHVVNNKFVALPKE